MKKLGSRYKPGIIFNEKELPQVKSWKVGQKYHLMLEVEMTSLRKEIDYHIAPLEKMSDGTAPKIISAGFEVKAVGAEEEDYGSEYARRMKGRRS